MKTGLVVWGTAGVLALTGCTGSPGSSSRAEGAQTSTATSSAPASASATSAGPRIPDGSWSKVATAAEARRRGLDAPIIEEMLGADGKLPITLRIAGGRWAILVTEDDGVPVGGDEGTLSYDGRGRLVTVSESEGCPGCVGRYTWTLDGDALRMAFAPGGRPAADDERLVTEGIFRRDR